MSHEQSVRLTLNAPAVRELFPEGTQARMDLSSAVIAEICKKTVTSMLDTTAKAFVMAECRNKTEEFSAELKKQGLEKYMGGYWRDPTTLPDKLKSDMSAHVSRVLRETTTTLVSEQRGYFEEELKRVLPLLLNRVIEEQIRLHLKDSPLIREVAEGILREKLQQIKV